MVEFRKNTMNIMWVSTWAHTIRMKSFRCDAKFKQQKDLRVHILRIHNLNQMKEDYQEAEKKKVDIFKCNECER